MSKSATIPWGAVIWLGLTFLASAAVGHHFGAIRAQANALSQAEARLATAKADFDKALEEVATLEKARLQARIKQAVAASKPPVAPDMPKPVAPASLTIPVSTPATPAPEKPAAARLVARSGMGQDVRTGEKLANPLVMAVLDQVGKPCAGVNVRFRAVPGDTRVSISPAEADAVTDERGEASASFTAGPQAGNFIVRATVPDSPQIGEAKFDSLTITAPAPPPAAAVTAPPTATSSTPPPMTVTAPATPPVTAPAAGGNRPPLPGPGGVSLAWIPSGGFYAASQEVSKALYQQITGRATPAGGQQHPALANNMTYAEAKSFCERLNQIQTPPISGFAYRLPRVSEWNQINRQTGILNTQDGVSEWTEDTYSSGMAPPGRDGNQPFVGGPGKRAVCGANAPMSQTYKDALAGGGAFAQPETSRGGYIGFRIILAPVK